MEEFISIAIAVSYPCQFGVCFLEQDPLILKVNGYYGRKIHYLDMKGNECMVETDTINSLETNLNKFIRKIIKRRFHKEWLYLYSNGYGIENGVIKEKMIPKEERLKSTKNRDKWFVKYFD